MRLYKLEIEYDRFLWSYHKVYVSTSREGLEKIIERIQSKFTSSYAVITEYEVGQEPVQIINISNSIDD